MRTILYEGENLTKSGGAGIATYARNLAAAARWLEYSTKVLVGVDRHLDRKEQILNEVTLYDARPRGRPSLAVLAEIGSSAVFGKPFGIRPTELHRTGAVVDPAQSNLAGFEAILAVPKLFDIARLHFRRYRRRAALNLGSPPSIFHATQPVPLMVRNRPNLYTIHDLIPLKLPYATHDDKKYFYRLVKHLCNKADHIVTVSESSRRDIIDFFGIAENRITNTYQSVSIPEKFMLKTEQELADDIGHAFNVNYKEYFLFVGAIEPKKNVSRLIDAYAASGSRHPLVIAGGLGWDYDDDVEKIKEERFLSYRTADQKIFPERHVRRFAYVPFGQLVSLIRGARAVLFPSLYEGFGLPVLEAMLLGTPVMTSNISSLPEVAGDAAVLIDPTDIDQMAMAIRRIDQDAELRSDLSAKGREQAKRFSTAAYRQRLGELYRGF